MVPIWYIYCEKWFLFGTYFTKMVSIWYIFSTLFCLLLFLYSLQNKNELRVKVAGNKRCARRKNKKSVSFVFIFGKCRFVILKLFGPSGRDHDFQNQYYLSVEATGYSKEFKKQSWLIGEEY